MPELTGLPIITGPTCSGKTELAISLCAEYPIEIISADSRQVIRHLDIGTAKPTAQQKKNVRFHLLDLIEPGERYSAARFIDDATQTISDIIRRDRIPLIVGGTGLYLKSLIEGVADVPESRPAMRRLFEQKLKQIGSRKMWEKLRQIDPAEAARIHPNNAIRIIRALEIFELTGQTKTHLISYGTYKRSEFKFTCFCLLPERETLYERINRRTDSMLTQGLPEEVARLAARGMTEQLRMANVIGYNELLDHIEGTCTLEEAAATIKQNSRQYAKRQMSWIRTQMSCVICPDSSLLWTSLTPLLTAWRDLNVKS